MGRIKDHGIVVRNLLHIYGLVKSTGYLQHFILFGSFITAKPDPNDVDVILVMKDAFSLADCPLEARGLFDHALAQVRYGASIFWIRPGLLMGERVEDFVAFWQGKRDGSQRGLVEVVR